MPETPAPRLNPPDDPNAVSFAEFCAANQELRDEVREGRILTDFTVIAQAEGLRTTGGWLFISLGLWAFLIGCIILTENEKGRP